MVGPSKEIQRSLLSLGSSQPQRRSLLSTMFSRGAWSQDGKGHREWIFPSKEWRVTFGIRLSTAEQAVQMQSDLLGNVRLGHTCLAGCAGGFVRLHIPRRRTSSPQPGPGGALESCCSSGESHWGPTDSRHSSRLHRAVALGILTCSITSRSEFWTPAPELLRCGKMA